MNILALETSTKSFSLAVLRNEKVIAERTVILKKVLSDSIIPSIDRILKKSKLSLKNIDGFAVGLGPGSFTSLRVGLSTVKGLAFATGKPIVGVASLDALALNVPAMYDSTICAITDGKRNLFYTCFYKRSHGALKAKTNYLLIDSKTLQEKLKKETIFTGDGIKLLPDELKKNPYFTFLDERFWYPKAGRVGLLSFKRFQKYDFDDIDRLIPIYLYPDDCQVTR